MLPRGTGFPCSAKRKSEDKLPLETIHRRLRPGTSVTWTRGGSWLDGSGDARNSHVFRAVFVSHVDTLSTDRGGRKPASLDFPSGVRKELEEGKRQLKDVPSHLGAGL